MKDRLLFFQLMQLLTTNQSNWDAVESSLFLMSALAEKLPGFVHVFSQLSKLVLSHFSRFVFRDDNVLITPIVDALTTLSAPPRLCFQHTVLTLFGHLAQWFGKHPDHTGWFLGVPVWWTNTFFGFFRFPGFGGLSLFS
jgi:hypothetical protein